MSMQKCTLTLTVLALAIAYLAIKLQETKEIPKLDLEYWGPGERQNDDKAIRPFKISFKSSVSL